MGWLTLLLVDQGGVHEEEAAGGLAGQWSIPAPLDEPLALPLDEPDDPVDPVSACASAVPSGPTVLAPQAERRTRRIAGLLRTARRSDAFMVGAHAALVPRALRTESNAHG
jgi:hypothetical protein